MVLLSWCLGAHFTLKQEWKNSKACKPQQTRKSRSQQTSKLLTGLNKQEQMLIRVYYPLNYMRTMGLKGSFELIRVKKCIPSR